MKWKERMGLALSGALIGLTLLLIVDVHYRMNNEGFGRVSTGGAGGGEAALGGASAQAHTDNQVGSGQVGSAQAAGAGGGASIAGGAGGNPAAGGVPPVIGGDTAENQYANSKLSKAANVVIRQHHRDSTILHDKVQYAQPSNISQIVNNVNSNIK